MKPVQSCPWQAGIASVRPRSVSRSLAADRIHVLAGVQARLIDFLRGEVLALTVLANAIQLLRFDGDAITLFCFLALLIARLADIVLHCLRRALVSALLVFLGSSLGTLVALGLHARGDGGRIGGVRGYADDAHCVFDFRAIAVMHAALRIDPAEHVG